MADRLSDGRLAEIIAERRAAGDSFDQIAKHIYADHGVDVSGQTVANWWGVISKVRPTDGAA